MAITIDTPENILVGDIYAVLDDNGAAPALMPDVARILAEHAQAEWHNAITLCSILLGLALACAGFANNNVGALVCAALCFLVTALEMALWFIDWS